MVEFIKTEYPLIFVHGMFGWGENEGINSRFPYWGTTSGSLKTYLTNNEIECYEASVGPMSSAWDQACELYAQLKGTRVDYGKAHSDKHKHKRYGRIYIRPLLNEWSKAKKIHLIGHSFGGNTVRMLAFLLKYGSKEERQASGENTSPLFLGGQEDLICSVTAICTPLNGTDAYDTARRYKLISPLRHLCFNYACLLSRTKLHGSFVDFHLEQFGVNDTPGKADKIGYLKSVKALLKSKDNIEYDMSEKGTTGMNRVIKIVPSVYYFSYRFNSVENTWTGKSVPANARFIFLKLTSRLILHNSKKRGKPTEGNDGLVNVSSAAYPKLEPYVMYSEDYVLKSGIWNVMTTRKGDHGTPIGLFSDKETFCRFYDELVCVLLSAEYNSKTDLKSFDKI